MAGTEDRGNVVETALCNLAALAMDRGALDEAQDALRRCVATHTEGEMSRTITEKWPSTALAAPMPTTLPSSTLTTGTVASCSVYMSVPRWPGRKEPPPPDTLGRPALMAPLLSLALLSPALLCLGTMAATLPPPEEPSNKRTDGA